MLCHTTLLCLLNFSSNNIFIIMLLKLDQMIFRFWILHEHLIDVCCFLNKAEDVCVASGSNLIDKFIFFLRNTLE